MDAELRTTSKWGIAIKRYMKTPIPDMKASNTEKLVISNTLCLQRSTEKPL